MSLFASRIESLEADLTCNPPRISAYHDLPFTIFRYDAADEYKMRREALLMATRIQQQGRRITFISLAQVMWQAIRETEGIASVVREEQLLGFVRAQRTVSTLLGDADFRPLPDQLLQRLAPLDPLQRLAPLDPSVEKVFLVRAASLAPSIYRCAKLLDELHGRTLVPIVLFYPGSIDGNTALRFMAVTPDEKVALQRVEVSRMSGSGRLRIAGSPAKGLRDSLNTAFDFARSRKRELGIDTDLDRYDYHVQVVDLTSTRDGSEAGMAFFVALFSLIKGKSALPGLVIMGQVTIQGHVLPVRSLAEALQIVMDNGARRVLLPTENKRQFLDVSGDVVERVDPIFYSDPLTGAVKALSLI